MAGRPKEFDRDEILASAMEVFWLKGYSSTSIKDLEAATGIGRQSLYNEFTDKDRLFVEAVEHYNQKVTQEAVDTLTADGSAIANVRTWLESLIATATRKDRRGCMLTNATMCVEITDETMQKATADVTRRLEKAIRFAVKTAIQQGQLPDTTNVATMSEYLLSTAQGILVLGRMGKSRAKLTSILEVSLQTFST